MKGRTKRQWLAMPLALAVIFAALGSVAQAQMVGDPGAKFVPGPDMVAAKIEHLAAVFPDDGKMLVFGGRNQANNSELWDPVSKTFTYKSMNYYHAYGPGLARLVDGRYLIAGGTDDKTADSKTAEIYDSQKNSFTPTAGKMVNGHEGCGAGTLADGRVLVVGSERTDAPGSLYMDLFNPATGTFKATKALNAPRRAPLIVPSADGKALVIGGLLNDSSHGSPVELYDPASNGFTVLQGDLFPGESGWVTYGDYRWFSRSIPTQRLADGRYLFVAARWLPGGTFLEIALFTVNPATKAITKLPVTPPWPADFLDYGGGITQPLVDSAAGKAYLLLPMAGYLYKPQQRYHLYTVDLKTGQRNNPTGYYSSTTWLFEGLSSSVVLPDGRIFVTGGLAEPGGIAQKATIFICPPGTPRGKKGSMAGLLDLLFE